MTKNVNIYPKKTYLYLSQWENFGKKQQNLGHSQKLGGVKASKTPTDLLIFQFSHHQINREDEFDWNKVKGCFFIYKKE